MSKDEEVEMTLQETFDLVWHKFVDWACIQGKTYLSPDKASLIEQSIRRPPMLALLVINSMLKKRGVDDPEREESENHRKVILNREEIVARSKFKQVLTLEDGVQIPDDVVKKFFDYANVLLQLVDELNES